MERDETTRVSDRRLDAALVENELLRRTFSETTVTFEEVGRRFVELRVPRSCWLLLRCWRAADRAHGGAGSRWWRFSVQELLALYAVIDHSSPLDVPDHLRELTMGLLDELRTELTARRHEDVQS